VTLEDRFSQMIGDHGENGLEEHLDGLLHKLGILVNTVLNGMQRVEIFKEGVQGGENGFDTCFLVFWNLFDSRMHSSNKSQ